jgi:hypothetical protein
LALPRRPAALEDCSAARGEQNAVETQNRIDGAPGRPGAPRFGPRGKVAALAAVCVLLLAGCGIANPWPSIAPGPNGHKTVLLVGDSLLGQAAQELPRRLGIYGLDAQVIDEHRNTMGLLDPVPGDGRSVATWFEATITAHPADIVVFEFVGACSCAHSPFYGTNEFYTQWFNVAADLVQRAKNHGARVIWVESPPVRPDPTNNIAAVAHGLAFRDTLMQSRSGTGTAHWWDAFTDTAGLYQDLLVYDGAPHKVRFDDGVHFTEEGAGRAAIFLIAGLRPLL